MNGLFVKNSTQKLSLKSMEVQASIVDVCVEFDFIQTWSNDKTNPVEAVYTLVLDRHTAISKFVVTVDNKKIKGVVKEKEEAAEKYEDAIASGHGAFLVEKSSRADVNEFKMSVGNLPPGQTVKIEISFLALLKDEKGAHKFVLPQELLPSAETKIPVQVNISIFMSIPIKSIDGPKSAQVSADKSSVVWKREEGNKSGLEISINVEHKEPSVVIESDVNKPEVKSCMITHYPVWTNYNADLLEPKMEVIFVVDRSGSMMGDRWYQTKKAMNLLVHAIPQESKFNIIGFGSSQDWLFPQSVPYTSTNMEKADQRIKTMEADLGGTELHEPLKSIYSTPLDPEFPRVIIVLTDGCVDNRDKTIQEVKLHSGEAKLFSIGVGSGVDKALVNGLAESGRGKSAFVEKEADIDRGVMELFSKAFEPCLKNIKIDWGKDVNVKQTPSRNVTIANESRMVFFGLIEKGELGNHIAISATDPEGSPLSWKIPVTENRKGDVIQRLTAYSLIRDLQEGNSAFHTGSKVTEEVEKNIKKEIIRLGVTYQLASKYTSFVAVDERDNATEGTMVAENVPTQSITAPEPNVVQYSKQQTTTSHSRKKKLSSPVSKSSSSSGAKPSPRSSAVTASAPPPPPGMTSPSPLPPPPVYAGASPSPPPPVFASASPSPPPGMSPSPQGPRGPLVSYGAPPPVQGSRGGAIAPPQASRQSNSSISQSPVSASKISSILRPSPVTSDLESVSRSSKSRKSDNSMESIPMKSKKKSSMKEEKKSPMKEVKKSSMKKDKKSKESSESFESFESSKKMEIEVMDDCVLNRDEEEEEAEGCEMEMEEEVIVEEKEKKSKEISKNLKSFSKSADKKSASPSSEKKIAPIANIPVNKASNEGQIISAQKFDGSWDTSSVSALFGITQEKFNSTNPGIDSIVWATAIAIAYLSIHFHKSQAAWQMNVRKAKAYMAKALPIPDKKQAMEKAEEYINTATTMVKSI